MASSISFRCPQRASTSSGKNRVSQRRRRKACAATTIFSDEYVQLLCGVDSFGYAVHPQMENPRKAHTPQAPKQASTPWGLGTLFIRQRVRRKVKQESVFCARIAPFREQEMQPSELCCLRILSHQPTAMDWKGLK